MTAPDETHPDITIVSDSPTSLGEGLPNAETLGLNRSQTARLTVLWPWLERIDHLAARVLTGRECAAVQSADLADLEAAVMRKFRPLAEAVDYLRLLARLVEHGRQERELGLPPPHIPNLVKRPTNPLNAHAALGINQIRRLNTAFDQNLKACGPFSPRSLATDLGARFQLGRLLFSAITHSGLHHAALLVAFVRSLADPRKAFGVCGPHVVASLPLPWQGIPDMEKRHWYPQPVTSLLLMRLPNDVLALAGVSGEFSDRQIRDRIWSCLQAYFAHIELPRMDCPRSLRSLLRAVADDGFRFLPPIVLAYSHRRLISHSLRPQTLARLHGGIGNCDLCKVLTAPIGDPPPANGRFAAGERPADFELPWLPDLRVALKLASRATMSVQLDVFLANWTARDQRAVVFGEFARYLLTVETFPGQSRSPQSARTTALAAARRLGCMAAGETLVSFSTETLETIYVDAIDVASEGGKKHRMRRTVASVLRDFHRFLVHRYGKEPVNEREIFGFAGGLLPVDANLLSLDEYEAMLDWLETHAPIGTHSALIRVARLVATLAFRTGMRRMEVLMLRLCDLKIGGRPTLLVRPFEERRLKTKSSTRTLPLYALLDEEELAALTQWFELRRTAARDEPNALLFEIPEWGGGAIPQERIFPLIHLAMRAVTGDDSVRFHHLRHSFASWTFLRLQLSDLSEFPALFPNLPKTSHWLTESRSFRAGLYGNVRPTRRHAYAVASLLGHSGPDVSVEHYIHFFDLLQWAVLRHAQLENAKPRLIAASGLTKSVIYRRLTARPSLDTFAAELLNELRDAPRNGRSQVKPTNKSGERTLSATALSMAELKASLPFRLCQMIFVATTQRISIEDLAERFGFSVADAERLFSRGQLLAAMQGKTSGGWRHRMMMWSPDRRAPNEQIRVPCPDLPVRRDDLMSLRTLWPRFERLEQTRPDLCERVLCYYANNAWRTQNELVFRSPDEPDAAILYLAFLRGLGLKKDSIRIVSFDPAQRSRRLAAWKQALKLDWRQRIDVLSPTRKSSEAARAWLGIRPMFGNEHEGEKIDGNGAYGFRFLMTIAVMKGHFRLDPD